MMDRVLKEDLWCLDNDLLTFQKWGRTKEFLESSFKNVDFWLHLGIFSLNTILERWGESSQAN